MNENGFFNRNEESYASRPIGLPWQDGTTCDYRAVRNTGP